MVNNQVKGDKMVLARLIWGLLLLSQLMYLFGVNTLNARAAKPVEPQYFDFNQPLTMPFIGLALVSLIASIAIPRWVIHSGRKKLKHSLDRPLADLLPAFFTAFIIRLVLLESITLFGFVLAIVQHDVKRFLPFLGTSLLGFALHFPNETKVRALFADSGS